MKANLVILKVLARRLSNTLDKDFWVEAISETINRYGTPVIFMMDEPNETS